MYGRTYAHDACCSASGAVIAATMASAPVASQIGRNRAATTALAMNVRPGAFTFRGKETVKG